jgi:hypothetical protein
MLRTITIWMFSLGVGWETIEWTLSSMLEPVGFVFLVLGTLIYNRPSITVFNRTITISILFLEPPAGTVILSPKEIYEQNKKEGLQ